MSAADLLSLLLRASLEGALLLGLVWAVVAVWPRMPAGARAALWWLGSLRLLVALVPLPRFALPLGPAEPGSPVRELPAVAARSIETITQPLPLAAPAPGAGEVVVVVLLAVWCAGVLLGGLVMLRRLLALRRMWKGAAAFRDPRIERWRDDWALTLGREQVPEVRTSRDASAPLTIGAWRPGILLPESSERLSDDALRLVFAHEVSHIRRRDALLAWVPALAELIFWFHPLARLGTREYLSAREEACDAEALRATQAPPREYGALLLEYGTGRTAALPGSAACGATPGRHLKRRLEMLARSPNCSHALRLAGTAAVVSFTLVAFAPLRFASARDKIIVSHDKHEHSRVAYLVLTKGVKGSRGSIDLDRDLDWLEGRADGSEDLIYFRIGDVAWLSRDPQLRREVLRALEEEDRFEARMAPTERRRKALEREEERIDERQQAIEEQKEELERRKEELHARGPGPGSEGALDALERERRRLDQKMQELFTARSELHRRYRFVVSGDQAAERERERIDQQVLRVVERVGRQAIKDGSAERLP